MEEGNDKWDDGAILSAFDKAIRIHSNKKDVKKEEKISKKDGISVGKTIIENSDTLLSSSQGIKNNNKIGVERIVKEKAAKINERIFPPSPKFPNIYEQQQYPTYPNHSPSPQFNSSYPSTSNYQQHYSPSPFQGPTSHSTTTPIYSLDEEAMNALITTWYNAGFVTGYYKAKSEGSGGR